ncbi:MAG TPA: glycosyltransferase family 1 protein [Fodinibius sp.]|nr:glycosyltransferase family 1 protein [Fodinibius sp.]
MKEFPLAINGHFLPQTVAGVQRYAYEIIRQFEQQGHSFRYVKPPGSLQSDTLRQLWMQGVMPFKMKGDELLWSPTNIGPVAKKNHVITLHDISDQLYPEWFDRKYVQWRSFILPPLLKRVKGIITVSEYSKQTILEQFPFTKGKVKVIYNGVETDHFYSRDRQEIAALRRKFDLHKPFVITVGSLDPRKNLNGLLEAWNQLPEMMRKETDLVVAGGGMKTFAFEIKEKIDNSVRFLGYVPDADLPGLYTAAEAFIYPSLFEGFGLPVLEAMACRTPVITSNSSSLQELADGYALTVDPHNSTAIAQALQRMLDSRKLRNELVEKAYSYARGFKWSVSAKKTYDYLKERQSS